MANTHASTAFVLDESQLAAVTGRAGSRKPARYLAEVQQAIDAPDSTFGIPITEDSKDKTIVSQLMRSAADLKVKVRIFSRPNHTLVDGTPAPFVGFQYRDKLAE